MGIEGGSNNNEIQNQEIQQATNEQVEQSQALHERNAEELEANSTIDNEGERKQIEGKDEATESQDEPSDSDELAENDKIEEETQQEPQPEEVQEDINRDELADDNTIANDVSDGMGDDINEDEEEDLEDDPLAEDDSIDTEEPLEDDSESEEDEYDDLADDDTIEAGDEEDDTADDIDEEEEDSLASDDSIEAESDEDEDVEAQAKEDENNETSDEAKETEDQAEESETNEDTDKVEDSEDQTEESETDEDTDKVEDSEDQTEESETDEDTDKAEDTEDQAEEDETDEDTDKVEDTEDQAEEDETGEDTDKIEDTEDQAEEDETDEDTDKIEDTEDQTEEGETDEDTDKVENTEDQAEEDETDEDTDKVEDTEDQAGEDETDESADQTEDKPEGNESEEKPDDVEDSEDQAEGEDSEDKPDEADEADDTATDDSTEEENAENQTDDASNGEATDGDSESGNAGSDVMDDSAEGDSSDNAESNSDGSEKDKLEDYSFDELYGMLDQPGGKERVMSMVADFQERYEADMWGMTQEEYQDYKAAKDRYEKEQEEKEKKESGDDKLEQPEPSKAQQNAENLLEKFNSQDEKSRHAYMTGGKAQTLKDISDQNTQMLHDLKDARQDVQAERDSVMKEITAMNYDGTKESNPKKYEQLCAKYYELDSLSERLDYSIVKTDMNNYDISEVAGTEYRNEGTKKLDGKEIDKAFGDAEKTLQNGVNDDKSIMDAYRLGEKINHDVLPSLDASIREVDSRLTMANGAQESYLREHGCTHEDAMAHPDGQYAKNELYKQSIEKERDAIAEKMTHAVELSTALHDQVPMVGSDCTLKVIDNKNGTVTIERAWDNGGAKTSEHAGKIHNSETTFYRNALERKDSVTVGQNSGSVYGHQFSFQYRGLAFKREDTFGGENVKLKNVAEGGFGNFNFSAGYKRGTEGKSPTASVEASGSVAQLKDTASVVVKDKEYKALSAEVACLKANASAKVDSNGILTAKASAYTFGADASIGVGNITVGKVSGRLGEASASYSSLTGEGKAGVVESKNSGSIGNNLTLAKGESKDLDVSTKNILGKIKEGDISESDVMDAKKDLDSIKDATKGKLGDDISEKKAAIGNEALKKPEGETKPLDYEAKEKRDSEPLAESSKMEVNGEVKKSLESFSQSNWDKLDVNEKKEAVSNLANAIASDLRLKEKPVIEYYSSEKKGDFGGYSRSENVIYVNENYLNDAVETADTIAHESRHCWQHELAENGDGELAKAFRDDHKNYIKPDDDWKEYREQSVEKDARDYASSVTNYIPQSHIDDAITKDVDTSAKVDTYKNESKEKGAVFDDAKDTNDKEAEQVGERIPVSGEVLKSLEKSGLTPEKIEDIRSLPKPDKPDPKSYLNEDYYKNHLKSFETTGCYRIERTDPRLPDHQYGGNLGHSSGLFVTSGAEMKSALEKANGDISKLEKIFGMEPGTWNKNSVIVRIDNPQNMRIPSGNELSAFPKYFVPGGYTSGNQPEIVIDSVPKGEYQVKKLSDSGLMDWVKKDTNTRESEGVIEKKYGDTEELDRPDATDGLSLEQKQKIANEAARDYNQRYHPYETALSKGIEGIKKTENGGVSFEETGYIYRNSDGNKCITEIIATGSRLKDFDAANKAMGLSETPDGYVWHHVDDFNVEKGTITLELVEDEAHLMARPHAGGCKQYDAVYGKSYNR